MALVARDRGGARVQRQAIVPLRSESTATFAAGDQRAGYLTAKRTFDLVVASVALIALLPLILAVAVLIRLTSPGPAIFRQTRCGKDGRLFTCYKFRTMVQDAERILDEDGELRAEFVNAWKLERDPRVTRLGVFLRKSSIDELPQLLNVLRGEMSIVGPRPVQPDELARFGRWAPTVTRVKPGLTGLWQVSGRSEVCYEERVEIEVDYVRHCGFWYDLVLVLRTIPTVILTRGAV
jgi:lipopolysaccharide/colanic/teichoic acid biosynthesis glycosyltransferase